MPFAIFDFKRQKARLDPLFCDKYQGYPIQLIELTLERALTELVNPEDEAYIKWNLEADVNGSDSASGSFRVKHTHYDSEENTIIVGCKVESYAKDRYF